MEEALEALFEACKRGDLKAVKAVVKSCEIEAGDLDYFNHSHEDWPQVAGSCGAEITQWLFKRFNLCPERHNEILEAACTSGPPEAAKWAAGALSPNLAAEALAKNKNGIQVLKEFITAAINTDVNLTSDAIYGACEAGNAEALEWLLNLDYAEIPDMAYAAAKSGSIETLNIILSRGETTAVEILPHMCRQTAEGIMLIARNTTRSGVIKLFNGCLPEKAETAKALTAEHNLTFSEMRLAGKDGRDKLLNACCCNNSEAFRWIIGVKTLHESQNEVEEKTAGLLAEKLARNAEEQTGVYPNPHKIGQLAKRLQKDSREFIEAARTYGNVEVANWVYDTFELNLKQETWIEKASVFGNVAFVQWINEKTKILKNKKNVEIILEKAIQHNYIELVKWLRETYMPIVNTGYYGNLFLHACGRFETPGQIEWILKDISASDLPEQLEDGLRAATESGHIKVAKWLWELLKAHKNAEELEDTIEKVLHDCASAGANRHIMLWMIRQSKKDYAALREACNEWDDEKMEAALP